MRISNENNMELMARYPDNYFDLAIVDPPYGIDAPNMKMGANKNKNKAQNSDSVAGRLKKARFSKGAGKLKSNILNKSSLDWDKKPPKEYFDELFRVSKNQIIFGGNYFELPATRCCICWDKVQPWDNFSQWEMVWTSFHKPSPLVRISNKGGNTKELKIHPTQKPVKLYEWILTKFAKENDKVLDTHLGSGSIAIACHNLGFELTACELDREYYLSAIRRLERHKYQLRIVFKNDHEPQRPN